MEGLTRLLFLVAILSLTSLTVAQASTCTLPVQTVPFQNITLFSNCTLPARYSFGAFAILFCYTNDLQNNGTITWTYKGNPATASLPIFLKTNGNYQGSFANANDSLAIQNNTRLPLIVSCQFAF